ncbi:MAG TPA: hypothetical protein VGX94_12345 [Terriglobia bacterium]|nr:hypothetical protein [Terriglobia bacterium]
MSETTPPIEAPPIHRHEPRDANARSLMWFGVGLLALIIFGYVVTEVTFHYFVGQRKVTPPTSLFSKGQMPPAPLIQERPGQELQGYLKEQDQILNSYGWVDRKAGVVRIPVSQAMTLLLQKGLPVRTGAPTLAPSAPHELPRGDFGPAPEGVKGPQKQ